MSAKAGQWQEQDGKGVLSCLDRATWLARKQQLEKLGGLAAEQ